MEKLGVEQGDICALTNVNAVKTKWISPVEIVDTALGGERGFDIKAIKDVNNLVSNATTWVGKDGH